METYDVVVIGTGAGGGMAIKTLCEDKPIRPKISASIVCPMT
jgi:hypothetical protein